MKIFNLNREYSIVCEWNKTRYGFRHVAHLMLRGREVAKAEVCYYNRTWEAYEYQSVCSKVIRDFFNEEEALKQLKVLDCVGC